MKAMLQHLWQRWHAWLHALSASPLARLADLADPLAALALDDAAGPACAIDAQGQLMRGNAALAAMIGGRLPERGSRAVALFPPSLREAAWRALHAALQAEPITQAALPYLRAQRSGHIIQVSSIGGITAFPLVGAYHASKWALEGFSQSLAQEVAPFGIHVTLIEPGGFDTDWSGPSSKRSEPLPDYAEVHQQVAEARAQRWSKPGDPKASAAAILKVVDAPNPPLRVFFGEAPLQIGRLNLRLMLARDAHEGYTALGVVRGVERRADGRVTAKVAQRPRRRRATALPHRPSQSHAAAGCAPSR